MPLSRSIQEIRVQFRPEFGRQLLLQLWSQVGACSDFGKKGAGVSPPSSSVKA
uniref:Uncharacterized protein n=1 Tax=Nelumbo nucifera TaxID=4432 RepID=A0A822ZH52_NELNU|nr:TPA_asm: hypothetical protein HUJ06_001009 [Nelumbo nucifera]